MNVEWVPVRVLHKEHLVVWCEPFGCTLCSEGGLVTRKSLALSSREPYLRCAACQRELAKRDNVTVVGGA